jgi:hypothetical protein
MTAYVAPGTLPVVGFITDYVSSALTAYTKTLVKTYRQCDSNREMQRLLIVCLSDRSWYHRVGMWICML